MNEKDGTNVRVAVRIRPLCARERLAGANEVISALSDGRTVLAAPDRHFTFDNVFPLCSPQYEIFDCVARPIIDGFIDGFNGTILAYGQTGSGKTFTMGTGLDGLDEQTVGIIPRAVDYLFGKLNETFSNSSDSSSNDEFFELYVSFLELYNEEIIDLLNPSSQDRRDRNKRPVLTIREDSLHGICIAGIKEEKTSGIDEILECLQKGQLGRTTKSTEMNLVSSRSHAIFTITLRQKRVTCDSDGIASTKNLVSKLHFVDLAGSERLKRTGVVGQRAKESISINSGLLALGNVISALGDESKKSSHVPYRDSKLTRLLQDSLGGNSRTAMIACVSPSSDNYAESVNTLKYANRARNIKNNVSLMEDAGGNAAFEIMQLKKQVAALKTEIFHLRGTGGARKGSESSSFSTPRKGSTPDFDEVNRLRSQIRDWQRKFESLQKDKISIEAERDFLKSCVGNNKLPNCEKNVDIIKEHLNTIAELKAKLYEQEKASKSTAVGRRKTITGPVARNNTSMKSNQIHDPSTVDSPPPPVWFTKANAIIDRTRQELANNENYMTEVAQLRPENVLEEVEVNHDGMLSFVSREAFASAVMAKSENLISQLQTDQRLKEELIVQLENGQQEYLAMRRMYEERLRLLQNNLSIIQKERDQALKEGNTGVRLREDQQNVRLRYEERIKKLGRELNEVKNKLADSSRDNGSKSAATEITLKNLRSSLQAVKSEKIRLQSRLDEITSRMQVTFGDQDGEIRELRQRERKATEQARKYKKAYDFQKTLLQKRVEQYMQTKNRVRYLVNALRKHRIPLSPSIGNINSFLESPNSSWRKLPPQNTTEQLADQHGHLKTPSRISSGLASKSISAADLEKVANQNGIIGGLSSDEEGVAEVNPMDMEETCPSSSSVAGDSVAQTVLRMSPLLPRGTDIFTRIADSTSFSLAPRHLSQIHSGWSSPLRSLTRSNSAHQEAPSPPVESPMKIDQRDRSSVELGEDIISFYQRNSICK